MNADEPGFEITRLPFFGWLPEARADRRLRVGGIHIPKSAKDQATKKRRQANKKAHKQRMKNRK